jgi:hypothetical protein
LSSSHISWYGTSSILNQTSCNSTYTAKFDSILHFFIPEKVEKIREKMVKKLIEVNRRLR